MQGLLLDAVPGALWSREMLHYQEPPDLVRVVVGVDPSISEADNAAECGIVVAGEGTDGNYYVLEDASLRASPYQWSHRAIQARDDHGADWIIAEGNQGGELVRLSLRTVDPDVPVRVVYASVGKYARAEPVSALYEQGRVYHAESFIDLEDQMCTWTAEDGPSPDRLDALVWALTELGVSRRRPQRIAAPMTVELRG